MVTAFRRATTYRDTASRPAVPISVGRICASQAVEYTRLYNLADQLWMQPPRRVTEHTSLAMRAFRACTVFEPAYAWGLRRGLTWLPSVRNKIREALLRADAKHR